MIINFKVEYKAVSAELLFACGEHMTYIQYIHTALLRRAH